MPSAPSTSRAAALSDEAGRDLIRTALDRTLFVNAGAGSGKTSTLVDRVVALVVSGTADLENIAAITFTEKAAAELRDRVRQKLEDRCRAADDEGARRCRSALDQLDRSPIGTLHAFAQRILSEYPVEARLPPRVDVLDEVSSDIEFDQRWRTFSSAMLGDPAMERTLLLLLAGGIDEAAARALALAFEDNWDLVEARVPRHVPEPPDLSTQMERAFSIAEDLAAMSGRCQDPEDNLHRRIQQLDAYLGMARESPGEIEMLEALRRDPPSCRVGTVGKAGNWGDRSGITPVRQAVIDLGEAVKAAQDAVMGGCALKLASAIRSFTLDGAAERQAAGRLDFHDLLVLARRLLSDSTHGPEVRRSLARRYDRLLLDEFQDTDPIQIELAVRIAAAPGSLSGEEAWDEIEVRPGALFVVGDPKQSIYRFRRADIATFLKAERMFAAGNVTLSANFRTAAPVIDWINGLFARLFALPLGSAVDVDSQPGFQALDPTRKMRPPAGPSVSGLGLIPLDRDTRADAIRGAEAEAVARAVARIADEGWSVDDGAGAWRRAKLSDIAILVPARTSLPFLEDALEERDIAYRAESSSLVFATRPVRDLLMVLRAADDPTDELKVVGALRTPLLGCGDDDLWNHRQVPGNHWDYTRPQGDPDQTGGLVADGLRFLSEIHRQARWLTPSEVLDRVITERRAMELGLAGGRERDVWRRLRFVVDQARAWSEATHGTLRQYLRWVDRQAKESARVSEPILAESDHDAVRIMTIHAAKGLEFPITILSGMSTEPRRRPGSVEVVFPTSGGVGYKLGRDVTTSQFEINLPIDEQMGLDERIRLLYVAATRARDHLVVSLFRKERSQPVTRAAIMTNAELVVDALGPDGLEALPEACPLGPEQTRLPVAGLTAVASPAEMAVPIGLDEWQAEMQLVRVEASRPRTVAATALSDEGRPDAGAEVDVVAVSEDRGGTDSATGGPGHPEATDGLVDPGLQKRPRDMDLAPWLKGRYGTSVGRAVHGVMQTIDLGRLSDRGPTVAAQCQAEAIPDQELLVARLVEDTLGSPSVARAAGLPHWREVYVCVPLTSDRLLEGYVDLLYRSPEGLVIVDYKTSASSDPTDLDRRTMGYRAQGAAYALAISTSTGETVTRVVFVFLTPNGAVERSLPDLAETVRELEHRLSAGREVVL